MLRKRPESTYIVRHSLPGRVRLVIPDLKRLPSHSSRLVPAFEALDDVVWARFNSVAGSLVIAYKAPRLTLDDILQRLEFLLSEPRQEGIAPINLACAHPDSVDDGCSLCAVATRQGPGALTRQSPIAPATRRFALVTGLGAAAFLVSRTAMGMAATGLLSPVGLLAALAAIPLAHTMLRDIKHRSVTLESFLGGAVVAAIVAGEAIAALEILWIHAASELLTAWITDRSRRAISGILDVTAKNTFIYVDGIEVETPVDQVKVGDVAVLHTGEKIAVDGEVIDGEALVDEAPISGRPDFVRRATGDTVYAGTFVRKGVLFVKVTCVGDATYLARILCMVEDSLERRAPIEGVGNQLARTMVRLGFAATLGALFITGSLWRAFTVMLVMACPCATALAASTAVSASLSAAAKRGILIKGGRYLEAVGTTDTVCFDKTGTLTTNEPVLEAMVTLNGQSENELLKMACSAESHNFHPLALAIKAEAKRRGIEPIQHEVCDYTLGMGVNAVIEGKDLLVGSRKFMDAKKVDVRAFSPKAGGLKRRGLTVLYVVWADEPVGLLAFANQDRPETTRVVQALRNQGVKRMVLITGDEPKTAEDLASRLGMDACHASVMPEAKGEIVARLKADGRKVLMVGDGINDALALARADVGVAMGAGGSETAIEAADIALVHDDLEGLAYVRGLSRQTVAVARQNFWLATATNLGGAAAGALGVLSPLAAGLLHIVHTAAVLTNSSRLLRYDYPVTAMKNCADAPKETS